MLYSGCTGCEEGVICARLHKFSISDSVSPFDLLVDVMNWDSLQNLSQVTSEKSSINLVPLPLLYITI